MKKRRIEKQLLLSIILALSFHTLSSAQEEEDQQAQEPEYSSASLGIRAGYTWPFGEWQKHPFAPVDQFRGGLTIGGDLEFRLSAGMGLSVTVDYAQLDVSDWEEYAASKGDHISVSASMTQFGLVLRPYLRSEPPSILKLDLGLLLSLPSGKESGEMFSYKYNFLKSPRFGILLGLEYEYFLSRKVAIHARGGFVFNFGGIEYADGTDYSIMVAPLTGGFRFHF